MEGDLLSLSSPPELKEIRLTHLMTDRYQHEQIVLELAPEKIVSRRGHGLGCVRESTDHSQMFVSFANTAARGRGGGEQMSILNSKGYCGKCEIRLCA